MMMNCPNLKKPTETKKIKLKREMVATWRDCNPCDEENENVEIAKLCLIANYHLIQHLMKVRDLEKELEEQKRLTWNSSNKNSSHHPLNRYDFNFNVD